jgi:hypothetical protein
MSNVTLKGLTPGAAYKAHLHTKASPFVRQLQQAPSSPLATGTADATGALTLNLPDRQEVLVQGPDGSAKHVLISTTRHPANM